MIGFVRSAIRQGWFVLAATLGVLVLAVVQLGSARFDYLPEFAPPSVQVQTEALGLSATEVEQLVTVPLEQDLLNGVPWLDHIHSRSQAGLSAIDVVFEQGTDLYAARHYVEERLTQAHALPNVGSPPVMIEPLASVSRVALVSMSSTSVPLIDMSVLARWKVRPKLMGLPGVANVSVYGMRDRQLQVEVDPAQLAQKGIGLQQVIETTGNALWVSPLTFVEASTPGTGGFVEGPNQRLAVQHVLPITTANSLSKVAVEGAQTPQTLADVATVVEDHQPLIGDAVNTGPSLFLVVQKSPGADTRTVAREVRDAMVSLQPGLSGISVDQSSFRPADYLDTSTRTLTWLALASLALLLLVTLLLTRSWRFAVVVGVSSVTVALGTLLVLVTTGTTLTALTFLGVAAGLVVLIAQSAASLRAFADDRGADLGAADHGGDGRDVAERLARPTTTTVVGTVLAALAIIPALALDPLTTSFTRAAVLSAEVAFAVSVLVAVAVVPALIGLLGHPAARSAPAWFRGAADPVRRLGRARSWAPWAAAVVLAGACLAALPQLGGTTSAIPQPRDTGLVVSLTSAQGTSLGAMNQLTATVADGVRALPGVTSVGGHVGRAISSDQLGDVNSSEVWVALSQPADDAMRAAVRRVATGVTGLTASVDTYSGDRLAQVASAGKHDLVVRLFGPDLTAMEQTASTVLGRVAAVDHVRDVTVTPVLRQPTVDVEVDLAKAQKYGLRPGDVRRAATTLVSGLVVGNLYEKARVFDVVVRGTDKVRTDLNALRDMGIEVPGGGVVRLGDVADVQVRPEPASVVHEQVQRSVDVVARIDGGDAVGVAAAVDAAVAGVTMPAETHVQVLSPAASRATDVRRALLVTLAVLLLLYLVLQAATGRWRAPGAVLVASILSAAGAVVVAPAVGGLGSAGAVAGATTAVLLGLCWGLAVARGHSPDGVLTGVVLVAAVALPVVVAGDRPGTELLHPFAVTLLGGLVSTAVAVLVVLPTIAGAPRSVQEQSLLQPVAAGVGQVGTSAVVSGPWWTDGEGPNGAHAPDGVHARDGANGSNGSKRVHAPDGADGSNGAHVGDGSNGSDGFHASGGGHPTQDGEGVDHGGGVGHPESGTPPHGPEVPAP